MDVEVGQKLYRAGYVRVLVAVVESVTARQCQVRTSIAWRVRASDIGVSWFYSEEEARVEIVRNLKRELERKEADVARLRGFIESAVSARAEVYEPFTGAITL